MASKSQKLKKVRARKRVTRGKKTKAEKRNKGTTKSRKVLFGD